MLVLAALLLFSTYPRLVMARGYHSNSTIPDWMVSLILIVGAVFLIVFSFVNAFENWRNKIFLKSVTWWVVAGLSCWLIISQLNWSYVLGFGLLGASWFLFCFGILAVRFVLKLFVGILFKPAQYASIEEFIRGVAFVGSLIGFVLMGAMIFVGIPIFIISKLFGLWD
ncbi:MAG: hypothetical protein JNK28_06435 [Burkholderiaceae bacterium]|nr:hypothetical protein [Burkholderiaceae bacterium]